MNLPVEIIHKLMVQERVTLEEYTRGVWFLGVKSFLRTASQRGQPRNRTFETQHWTKKVIT